MRYLGIDYGTKKVGLALSDEGGTLAFPHSVLKNNPALLRGITDICQKEKVKEIVIGESLDYKGKDNLVMEKILPFKKNLNTRTGIPIHFQTEILTTREAKRVDDNKTIIDARAATLMLQS